MILSIKDRYCGIQTIFGTLNTEGCHFLVLCSIVEEYTDCPLDIIDAIRISQSKGWVTSDFYVKDALSFLEYYTGKKWTRSGILTRLPIKILDNQFTEVIHENMTSDKKVYTHFKRRAFDTLEYSNTVTNGKILGYYIYTVQE